MKQIKTMCRYLDHMIIDNIFDFYINYKANFESIFSYLNQNIF